MSTDPIHDRQDLIRRIDELTKTVEALEARLAPPAPTPVTGSRRDLLRLAGTAAAGAVAGGMLASAQPAAAATGQVIITGHRQLAANMTYLGYGSTPGSVLGNPLTSERTMLWIDNRGAPIDSTGIRGDGQGTTGVGVWGHSDYNGLGMLASGGLGLRATGARAALHLEGTNGAPSTRTDSHLLGEIDIDSSANVWLCVVAGTPGLWRKLGGPASAGAFHAISPVRAYDSRWPGGTRLSSGGQRLVSVADGHDILTGGVNAPDSVPAESTAVAYNLTVTATQISGFLTVSPGTATGVTASSINWSGDGQNLANGSIVGIDTSRQVRVFAGGGGSTDFVIDIVGYFL
ncbi:MAG TPA: hypothetical protein VE487_08640 [Ilumatobacter sp.]|jgi:hypothetical protein|nr:hypothetical protein [Ilumatobacter sp.]